MPLTRTVVVTRLIIHQRKAKKEKIAVRVWPPTFALGEQARK